MRITPKIRQLLKDKNAKMTQTELAKVLNVNQSTVNAYLNGEILDVRAENGRRICELVGLDYEAEVKRQKSRLESESSRMVSVGGDNSGTVLQTISQTPAGTFTSADLVRMIAACRATDADKGAVLRVLALCGIL